MHKTIASLNVKSVDVERRIITGIATTKTRDIVGDVVEPLGCKFPPTVPLLIAHDHRSPVGIVKFGKPTRDGVPFTAQMPKVAEPGPLKDRVDTAFGEVKHGLITAVSIGFKPVSGKTEPLAGGGLRFLECNLLELSLCAVGANPDARILEVRNARDRRAKPGVVKLSEDERIKLTALTKAARRIERRRALGLPGPVVKLTGRDLVSAHLDRARGKAWDDDGKPKPRRRGRVVRLKP